MIKYDTRVQDFERRERKKGNKERNLKLGALKVNFRNHGEGFNYMEKLKNFLSKLLFDEIIK